MSSHRGPNLQTRDILLDAFTRVRDATLSVVEDVDEQQLCFRADSEANSIAWLVWHLTRVQDDHVSAVAGTDQAWTSAGWAARFGLPFDAGETGYGHKSTDVGMVKASAALLAGYHQAVFDQTAGYVKGLEDKDLDRIVDRRWDPPVTLGVRLVSVIDDDLEHVGQAAFVRGLVLRRRSGP